MRGFEQPTTGGRRGERRSPYRRGASAARPYVAIAVAFALLALPVLAAEGQGAAPDPALASLLDRLQAKYAAAQDYTARFVQVADLKTMGKREEASGRVQFKKPAKMRWEYEAPEKKLLVTDGATVWLYAPADKQVIEQRFSEAYRARTPIALLSGKTKLTSQFDVTVVSRDAATGEVVLRLSPRDAATGMNDVRLTIHEPSLEIRATEFVDAYGNRTTVRFSDAKLNTKVPDSRFRFAPPPGTEVVHAP